MSNAVFQQIEQQIIALPYEDRLNLIERAIRSLRTRDEEQAEYERQLDALAADPHTQREIAAINREFACTDMDGLQ